MFKNAYGAYASGDIPNVAVMKAPHVFHGISGDVIVPESSSALERLSGANPLSA